MLEVLGSAVNEVCSVDVSVLSDVELHAAVVSLSSLIDRLQAVHAAAVSEWDARKLWSSDGSLSASARLSRSCGAAPGDARAVLRRARRLRSMPLVAEGYASGSLSSAQVDLLCRANQPELLSVFSRDEELLVSKVRELSHTEASKVLDYWVQCAREELRLERRDPVDIRSASLSKTLDGTVDLRALFDPISGEIFSGELLRLERELFESDWSEAREQLNREPTSADLARSAGQRRCDALVEMASRSAGSSRTARPLLTVVLNQETFGRVCELASGTVITPEQVVPLLTEAEIERIVFDGPSRVMEVGSRRLFGGALRRAIEVRDRHCQHPGCEVPAQWCEVDHVVPWSRGGRTTQENGQLMCAPHNRGKGSGPPPAGEAA